MKPSTLRQFYLTFVNLYGVIFYTDAYDIIKKYYPDLKKSTLLKDLKDRNSKMTRTYAVLKNGDKKDPYLIADEFLSDEEITDILLQQRGKPFFVCDKLEEYFEYTYSLGYNPGYQPMVDFAYDKMKQKADKKEARAMAEIFVGMICERIHSDCSDAMKSFNDLIQKMIDVLELKTKEEIENMLKLYIELQGNVKMFANKGFSPFELRKILPPGDPDNLVVNIGDNIRNRMMDNDVDIDEIIEDLKHDRNLPEKMRDDLIRQFEEMKVLKSNKAKA